MENVTGLPISTWNMHGIQLDATFQTISHLIFLGTSSRSHTPTTTEWKLVPDSSLQGDSPADDLCLELVSPVLKGEEGLQQLRQVMERLRSLGISTNRTCGFHVHVDATRGKEQALPAMVTLLGIKKIARSFLALENAFDLLVGLSWDRMDYRRRANQNRYCKSNRIVLGEVSNRQRWEWITAATSFTKLVRLVSPDRYRKLNLTNILDRSRPSTCEFRSHGGVEDLFEAEAWVRLLLRFCEQVSQPSMDDASICLLPQSATPKDELAALFQILDCHGLEQYFRVDRRLFLEERMANPWTCNVCRKVFQNSRSLSQHMKASNHHHYHSSKERATPSKNFHRKHSSRVSKRDVR
jgi:Putative amidoligase enzyme